MSDKEKRQTKSRIELLPWESGKKYKVKKQFTVTGPNGKKLTVTKDYEHDRYSFAPNLRDDIPSSAHDFAYDPTEEGSGRKWDDGTHITRADADMMMRDLMRDSEDPDTQSAADLYYKAVRKFGWWPWWKLWLTHIFFPLIKEST